MDIVRAGREGGILQTECIVKPGVFGVLGAYMVYGLVVCRVAQVDFIRSDSDNRAFFAVYSISIGVSLCMPRYLLAICLVQLADLGIKAAAIHETEISLVEKCDSCKFGARNVSKRVEVEPIEQSVQNIRYREDQNG
jgi:hypothetical protein